MTDRRKLPGSSREGQELPLRRLPPLLPRIEQRRKLSSAVPARRMKMQEERKKFRTAELQKV
jgi:hypothetical protein